MPNIGVSSDELVLCEVIFSCIIVSVVCITTIICVVIKYSCVVTYQTS